MNESSKVKFKYYSSYDAFLIIIRETFSIFFNSRLKRMSSNPDALIKEYYDMYYYTYSKPCDLNIFLNIFNNKKFYIDYINKKMEEYLMIAGNKENIGRFNKIKDLPGFEQTIIPFQIVNR